MDSSGNSVENPTIGWCRSPGDSEDGIGVESVGVSGQSGACTGAESGKQDMDFSTEQEQVPRYTYVQGSISQAEDPLRESVPSLHNEDVPSVKEDIQDTNWNVAYSSKKEDIQDVHHRHEESGGGPLQKEDTHPHENSVPHESDEGAVQGSVYTQDEKSVEEATQGSVYTQSVEGGRVYTQGESSGTNPVEVIAKGRASVLKEVIQESDVRFEAALGSQDTLAISIDRLTRGSFQSVRQAFGGYTHAIPCTGFS